MLHRIVAKTGPDEPRDFVRQLLRCGAKLLEDDTVRTAQEEVGKGRGGGDHPLVTRQPPGKAVGTPKPSPLQIVPAAISSLPVGDIGFDGHATVLGSR